MDHSIRKSPDRESKITRFVLAGRNMLEVLRQQEQMRASKSQYHPSDVKLRVKQCQCDVMNASTELYLAASDLKKVERLAETEWAGGLAQLLHAHGFGAFHRGMELAEEMGLRLPRHVPRQQMIEFKLFLCCLVEHDLSHYRMELRKEHTVRLSVA
jgi:hypothetical protein